MTETSSKAQVCVHVVCNNTKLMAVLLDKSLIFVLFLVVGTN